MNTYIIFLVIGVLLLSIIALLQFFMLIIFYAKLELIQKMGAVIYNDYCETNMIKGISYDEWLKKGYTFPLR